MIKLSNYDKFKMMQAIIFSDNQDVFKEDLDVNELLLTDKSLMLLRDLVSKYSTEKVLTSCTKENVYRIINYLRYNVSYDSLTAKELVYDLCSDMIRLVNSASDEYAVDFYRKELLKRNVVSLKNIPLIYLCLTRKYLLDNNEAYNGVIATDFDVLYSHGSCFDFMDFLVMAEEFMLKDKYYYSLNAIMSEYSGKFREYPFRERVDIIIDNTALLIKNPSSDESYFALSEDDVITPDVERLNKQLIKRMKWVK